MNIEDAKELLRDENFLYFGHGIGRAEDSDEVVQSIFRQGLRTKDNSLYWTSVELGQGGAISWEKLKEILDTWKHMNSKKIILIRLPIEFVNFIGNESETAEQLHAFYVQNGIRGNGRKQNYVNTKFIVGCYNVDEQMIEINPNFEQELTEETLESLRKGLEEAKRMTEDRVSRIAGPISKFGTAEERAQIIPEDEESLDDDLNWNENFWDDLEDEPQQEESSKINEDELQQEESSKINDVTINLRGMDIKLNRSLMEGKVKLPNGVEIPAIQYIKEVVAPHIPSSGKFILKNGAEISTKQFIEEVVLDQIGKFEGDISALLENTTKIDNEQDLKGDSSKGHVKRPGMGISQAQAERLQRDQEAQTRSKEREKLAKQHNVQASQQGKIKKDSLRIGIRDTQIPTSEVQEKTNQIRDRYRRRLIWCIYRKDPTSLTPEEIVLAKQEEQWQAEQRVKQAKQRREQRQANQKNKGYGQSR